MLVKLTGPECPLCGCPDAKLLHRHERTGTRYGQAGATGEKFVSANCRYQCNHCGQRWFVTEPWTPLIKPNDTTDQELPGYEESEIELKYAVRYKVIRCPKCGSDSTKVASTKRPIRSHKCLDCGFPFKSVEE